MADSVPRVLMLGRLSLYGERAERLHQEIVTVTARWRDPDLRREPLSPYAADAERKTMALLDELLASGRASQPSETVRRRLLASAARDIGELRPRLEPRAEKLAESAARKLRERGEREARELRDTLVRQRDRVKAELDRHQAEVAQLALDLDAAEKRQLEANKRAWRERLGQFERDLKDEPERMRNFYRVRGRPRGAGWSGVSLAGDGVGGVAVSPPWVARIIWHDRVAGVGGNGEPMGIAVHGSRSHSSTAF